MFLGAELLGKKNLISILQNQAQQINAKTIIELKVNFVT